MLRQMHMFDFASVAFFAYMCLSAVPVTWFWYSPTALVVSDARVNESPKVGLERLIKASPTMAYSVIIRNANVAVVCQADSNRQRYHTDAQLPPPGKLDLAWLAFPNEACHTLAEPGEYFVEVCSYPAPCAFKATYLR
jgi:hypothetical protein